MTLKEAIESGKPFRRESWHINRPWMTQGDMHNDTDIIATDWILKYDCETCRDTKVITVCKQDWGGEESVFEEPCPKCSAPKYKCKTCKDTKVVQEKFHLNPQMFRLPCPDCSAPKLKLEVGKTYLNANGEIVNIVKVNDGDMKWCYIDKLDNDYDIDGNNRRDFNRLPKLISEVVKDEPPKMKKITVYRPIINDEVSCYERGYLWMPAKEHWDDITGIVGWDEEVIEVLDEKAK